MLRFLRSPNSPASVARLHEQVRGREQDKPRRGEPGHQRTRSETNARTDDRPQQKDVKKPREEGCLVDGSVVHGDSSSAKLDHSGLAPPSAAVASVPPNPMVSTAEEGTMTIEPFSLMASY